MNINTRLLHFLFFLLRRPFNHWTDLPNPKQQCGPALKRFARWAAYKLLRYSRCNVFCVGDTTINRFLAWGYSEKMLVNLPIFVKADEDIPAYKKHQPEILRRYSVPEGGFLLSAGSRLIFEKGYDLLVESISLLTSDLRNRLRLVIVGSGDQAAALQQQINRLKLNGIVQIEKWLDITDFKALIANSDIFLHPARFDSFGGTTLGMALGVPVIGATGAGAAVDRIEYGVNGFLYEAPDTQSLARYISLILNDAELRQRMSKAARETAIQWHPSRGVDIILQNSI